jgi:TRAP-type C4-dicarboxylate transport system substrate-binding protein
MATLKQVLLGATLGVVLGVGAAHAQTKLRIASEEPFGNPPRVSVQYGLEHLRDVAPKRTGNAVAIELYANATLGSEKDLIRSVGTGIVDGAVTSPGNAGALIPEFQLFSASYLFTSYDHVKRVLASDAFVDRLQQIVRDRKLGFQLAGVGLTGTRNLYNRIKPVDTPDSMRGLTIRVMNSPTEAKVWGTLGLLPTNIPAPEIYSALQTGVIDAAESSLPAIMGGKYYEVAPYI